MSHMSLELLEDAASCIKGIKEEGVDDKGNLRALRKEDSKFDKKRAEDTYASTSEEEEMDEANPLQDAKAKLIKLINGMNDEKKLMSILGTLTLGEEELEEKKGEDAEDVDDEEKEDKEEIDEKKKVDSEEEESEEEEKVDEKKKDDVDDEEKEDKEEEIDEDSFEESAVKCLKKDYEERKEKGETEEDDE